MWIEKNGPTWRIRDEVGSKKVTVAKGFPTRTSAKVALAKLTAEKLGGTLVLPSKTTVGQWVQRWWERHSPGLKPTARRSEESRVRIHIIPNLGVHKLDDLTPDVVQAWVWDIAEDLSPKSVRNVHALLHAAMAQAVVDRVIRENPCLSSKMPVAEYHEMRFLTEPEAQRLLSAIKAEHRDIPLTVLGTGLRWGEMAGLRVKRVDVLERKLTVMETLVRVPGAENGVEVSTPKTRAGRRTISLPADVTDALIGRTAARDGEEWVFTRGADDPRPLCHTGWWHEVWKPAVVEAGLKGLRFHDLRHTHVAWLISGGVPLTAIQRRLGHASISITSDRYGHLLKAVDDDVLDVLDLALKGRERRGNLGGDVPPQRSGTEWSESIQPGQSG